MTSHSDFIQTLRRVKVNDIILQSDIPTWEHIRDTCFPSFLYMCIGHTCNDLFCEFVKRQIMQNNHTYIVHKHNVLNLFLYLSNLCVSVESLHAHAEYSLYFVRNVKMIYMKKAAEMIKAFCAHKRLVRVDKVLKYAQRTVIYEQLIGALDKEVKCLMEFLHEQIDIAHSVGDM